MAGGDQAFGGQEEGKRCPHGAEHRTAPSTLLQRAGQPAAARSRALLAGGVQASLKSSGPASQLASWGWGISSRKQIPTAIKKGHFLQGRPAWRGERALCCNRGEGRALTQPSAAGEAAHGHRELACGLPSSQHPQPAAAGWASRGSGSAEAKAGGEQWVGARAVPGSAGVTKEGTRGPSWACTLCPRYPLESLDGGCGGGCGPRRIRPMSPGFCYSGFFLRSRMACSHAGERGD